MNILSCHIHAPPVRINYIFNHEERNLNAKREFNANVDIASYGSLVTRAFHKLAVSWGMHTDLDELRKLYRLLSSILQVIDGEDL